MNTQAPLKAPLQAPTPLIDEARARAVRVKGFAVVEHLLDVVDSQVAKLKEITDADLSLAEMIEQEGAIKAIERQLAQIPVMLELAKEASHPLTKLVGILRSEAPIPGEPRAFATGSGALEPPEPEETTVEQDLEVVLKLYETPSEPKKKPKKRVASG